LNIEKIAKEIITGSIIGVVRGRSEHGPRALGNRSIIADATNSLMKDYINQKIKLNENFLKNALFQYGPWANLKLDMENEKIIQMLKMCYVISRN
jgi:hypothetical protein